MSEFEHYYLVQEGTGYRIQQGGVNVGHRFDDYRLAEEACSRLNTTLALGVPVGTATEPAVPATHTPRLIRNTETERFKPSHVASTYGPSVLIRPSNGFEGLEPMSIRITAELLRKGEQLTVSVIFNFSDSSVRQALFGITPRSKPIGLIAADFSGLLKDGVSLTSVAFRCQSSLTDSTAAAKAWLLGFNS